MWVFNPSRFLSNIYCAQYHRLHFPNPWITGFISPQVSASLINTILSTHSDWVREAAQRPTPNGWNTISCLKIIYCTQRLRMHNNPHHFSLCIKYCGKNSKKSKRELIGFFYLHFFHKYGICNQHSNTRHELLQKQKYWIEPHTSVCQINGEFYEESWW